MSTPIFEPPPTQAPPFIKDERGAEKFNPIWLKWFLKLVQLITTGGGGGGVLQHNSLGGLQGGTTGEYFHLTNAQQQIITGVQTANHVLAGPTSGSSAVPAFRALVAADLPGSSGAIVDGLATRVRRYG